MQAAPQPRWVIAELDVHGEIDAHAALCLRFAIGDARAGGAETILLDLRDLGAIGDARAGGAETILLDLRDLSAIDAAAASVLVQALRDCRAGGAELGLLICGGRRHDAITGVLRAAGLSDQLWFTSEPPASRPAALRAVAPPSALPAPPAERARTGARRLADARLRRSRSA